MSSPSPDVFTVREPRTAFESFADSPDCDECASSTSTANRLPCRRWWTGRVSHLGGVDDRGGLMLEALVKGTAWDI